MKQVRVGNGRVYEVPTTFAEGEEMITHAIRYHDGRGGNLAIQAACAQVAYGLFCHQELTPDPTTALAFLIQRLCRERAGGES
jgi:hypothetical protein